MKHPLWNILPRWLLAWLVCFALERGLGELLSVDSRWWLAAAVLLLWCALLAVTEHFRRLWIMAALWIAAFGLCLLLSDRKLLAEAALAVFSRQGAGRGYGELCLLLLCAAVILPVSALLRLYWARAALCVGWAALWIAAALLEWPLPRAVPAALIPLLLLTVVETVRRFRREPEPDSTVKRALLLWLLPTALLLLALPASAEPYGYPLLHSVAETVERLWHDAESALHYRQKGDREFGLSFNGVSDRAELGTGGEEDGSGVIFANPRLTPDGAFYLFGNAWERFDGRGWKSALEPEVAEYLNWNLDTAEHVYALWRLLEAEGGQVEFSDFYRSNSVYLNYRNMDVRTMFNVMDTTHITVDKQRFPYAETPTGTLFDYVQRSDVWYRVYYLESNVRTRGALIASAEGHVYDEKGGGLRWFQVAQAFQDDVQLNLRGDIYPEKTFAKRAALIRGIYLDCSGVSDRAAALAREITADCGSDWEKIAAIAAYLQGNYSYTLRPAPVPKGENFLDWLLFESREGYCSWYATAAALLSRSVGVPARYVQGYRGKLAGEEFTTLSPGDAHAWCECYIAGYGWVTVEATPGFENDGVGWLTAEEAGGQPAGGIGIPAPGTEPRRSDAGEDDAHQPKFPIPAGQGGRTEEPDPEQTSGPASSGWLAVTGIALLLAALAAVWLWQRARRKRRSAEANGAERLLRDLEVLLRDLRGKGYPRRPEESLRQYFERLPWQYLLASKAEAEEMAALYDRTFFALVTPSEAELAKHREFAARFRPRTLRQWMIWYRLQ